MINLTAFLLVFVATLIGAWGALYFKLAASTLTFRFFDLLKNTKLWLAVFFYGLSSIFFLIGLRMGDLSVLYPLTSLTYIRIVFLSIKVLKERMNFFKWLGMGLILGGVVLISLGL